MIQKYKLKMSKNSIKNQRIVAQKMTQNSEEKGTKIHRKNGGKI